MKTKEITKYQLILFTCLLLPLTAHLQTFSNETIEIQTEYGNIKVKLYEETPLHKANFIKHIKVGFYDSLLFHRVIKNFMIQGGDPNSKYANQDDTLGEGDLDYMVPAEFNRKLIHKKGVIAAARESDSLNPELGSSGCQFYLVQGKPRTLEELQKVEYRINNNKIHNARRAYFKTEIGKKNLMNLKNNKDSSQYYQNQINVDIEKIAFKNGKYKFTEEEIKVYTSLGGTPHLDGSYTVFGEIISGLEVVDKIADEKTNPLDRPLKDIRMKIIILED
ncbi:MAG: peptidylprolyl isomerase [Bacteroidia bacterium]